MKRLFTHSEHADLFAYGRCGITVYFCPPSSAFYAVYAISGITDMLDGFLARAMKQESEFGSRLDSVADLLFYSVMIFKVFPFLLEQMPMWLWYLVGAIVLIRAGSYFVAFCKYHRFASLHTYMNKLTGLLIFPVPYLLNWSFVNIYYTIICISAGVASSEELLIHLREPSYNERKKTIFDGRRKGS